jgi:hypothetical protein
MSASIGMLVEDLGRVAHDDGGDHRQRVGTHRGDGGDVAGQAAGAAGVAAVEAQHAGRRRRLGRSGVGFGAVSGEGFMGVWRRKTGRGGRPVGTGANAGAEREKNLRTVA